MCRVSVRFPKRRYSIKPISEVRNEEQTECEKYACLEWLLNHLIKIEESRA